MLDKYTTVSTSAITETVEKKSKFIAHVFPIKDQEEAEKYLAAIKKEYWNAAHNCYAYQIGDRNEIQRFSDDGEPQGTAGKPILDILKGQDIKNTLIIVTRYFGGTLLGTGGLVRAYGHAAKKGVLEAGLIRRMRIRLFELQMTYPVSGKVQYLLNDKNYVIRNTEYTHVVTFTVEVEVADEEPFEKWIIDQTNAEVSIAKGEHCFITVPYVANN